MTSWRACHRYLGGAPLQHKKSIIKKKEREENTREKEKNDREHIRRIPS
jgi:hypothetical protein